MNTYHYTEDSYEQTILDLFKEMGYDYRYGPELEQETARDLEDVSISCITRKQLLVINRSHETTGDRRSHASIAYYSK